MTREQDARDVSRYGAPQHAGHPHPGDTLDGSIVPPSDRIRTWNVQGLSYVAEPGDVAVEVPIPYGPTSYADPRTNPSKQSTEIHPTTYVTLNGFLNRLLPLHAAPVPAASPQRQTPEQHGQPIFRRHVTAWPRTRQVYPEFGGGS